MAMTVQELIQRLQGMDGMAKVELIVWDARRECDPGLYCVEVSCQCDGGRVYLQGPGELEEGEQEEGEE